jgi:hypothetical protein
VFDIDHIEALLQASAAAGRRVSYSEVLLAIGQRFTRPRMRALCKVLDEIDNRAAAAGQPELAALVVRESDRLPGQGWWVARTDYAGAWEGPEARTYLDKVQRVAIAYWSKQRPGGGPVSGPSA